MNKIYRKEKNLSVKRRKRNKSKSKKVYKLEYKNLSTVCVQKYMQSAKFLKEKIKEIHICKIPANKSIENHLD